MIVLRFCIEALVIMAIVRVVLLVLGKVGL